MKDYIIERKNATSKASVKVPYYNSPSGRKRAGLSLSPRPWICLYIHSSVNTLKTLKWIVIEP